MKKPKLIQLPPVRDPEEEYERIERSILAIFRELIYLPILGGFTGNTRSIKNAVPSLLDAISSGRVTFNRGVFSGRFNSTISRQIKKLGGVYDRSAKAWRLPASQLPIEIKVAIASSEWKFREKIAKIDRKLASIDPDEITKHIKLEKFFDSAIYKTDKNLLRTLRAITVQPQLNPKQRKQIAEDWQNNTDLSIKGMVEKQISDLRAKIQKSVFAGNRYEHVTSSIVKSYGVTQKRVKFIARQETKLLTSKLKEVRYIDAGITRYKWKSVKGTPDHEVRPMHKELNARSEKGEIFDFRYPPIDDPNGSRHNPGENYNCRCVAIPVIDAREILK